MGLGGGGGSQRSNNLKEGMKRDWNFEKGRVISDKFPSVGGGEWGMYVFWKYTLSYYMTSVSTCFSYLCL